MTRKFKAFDAKTINSEFAALPNADLRDLTHAMSHYQEAANVEMETTMLEKVMNERAAIDPEFAAQRPKMEMAAKLAGLRARLGLSQSEAARRLGVTASRVNEIETKPWTVSLDRIQAYAGILGARLELVLPYSPEKAIEETGVGLDADRLITVLKELAPLIASLKATEERGAMAC